MGLSFQRGQKQEETCTQKHAALDVAAGLKHSFPVQPQPGSLVLLPFCHN